MEDKPDFNDIGSSSSPEGEVETRKFQEQGRVDIPDDFYEHHGIEVGERIMVICESEGISIMKASKDNINND